MPCLCSAALDHREPCLLRLHILHFALQVIQVDPALAAFLEARIFQAVFPLDERQRPKDFLIQRVFDIRQRNFAKLRDRLRHLAERPRARRFYAGAVGAAWKSQFRFDVRAGLRLAVVKVVRELLQRFLLIVLIAEPIPDERHNEILAAHAAHEIRAGGLPDWLRERLIVLLEMLQEGAVCEHQLRVAVSLPPLEFCFAHSLRCGFFYGRQYVKILGIVESRRIVFDDFAHHGRSLEIHRPRQAQHAREIRRVVDRPAMRIRIRADDVLQAAQEIDCLGTLSIRRRRHRLSHDIIGVDAVPAHDDRRRIDRARQERTRRRIVRRQVLRGMSRARDVDVHPERRDGDDVLVFRAFIRRVFPRRYADREKHVPTVGGTFFVCHPCHGVHLIQGKADGLLLRQFPQIGIPFGALIKQLQKLP